MGARAGSAGLNPLELAERRTILDGRRDLLLGKERFVHVVGISQVMLRVPPHVARSSP